VAVRDDNLLHLLLTFSASHRARLLNHPEPANRIATWVRDLFPRLRRALYDSTGPVSNSSLATAIMLASLEIISPNTFEVPISWQDHLAMARQMVISRGGPKSIHRKDKVGYFLSTWFAYLDVLGSLSGSKADKPLASSYWASSSSSSSSSSPGTDTPTQHLQDDFQIDCLLGFTSHCIAILARIAELAKECEPSRLDPLTGTVRTHWQPPPSVIDRAMLIRADLQRSRDCVYKACDHRSPSPQHHASSAGASGESAWDSLEIYATNEAFHWAGLIHLYRRCLNLPSHSPEVQTCVREIVGALYKVRRGSTAEACLLFPMFAAGCEMENERDRERLRARLRGVEGFGMMQVGRARRVLERVWGTGRAWEGLVGDEFFG